MTGINERIKIRGFRCRARAKTAGEARSHDVEAPGMPKSVRREDAKPLSRASSPRISLALGRKREAEIDRRFAVRVGIPSMIKKPDARPHRTRRERFVVIPAKVLILTSLDSPEIVLKAAKEAFASGYIFKNQPNLLVENILALAKGYTAQEYLIASMAISGLTEAEMGVFQLLMGKNIQLQSSPKTIANQKTKILRKLGLESQKDLMHLFRLFRD